MQAKGSGASMPRFMLLLALLSASLSEGKRRHVNLVGRKGGNHLKVGSSVDSSSNSSFLPFSFPNPGDLPGIGEVYGGVRHAAAGTQHIVRQWSGDMWNQIRDFAPYEDVFAYANVGLGFAARPVRAVWSQLPLGFAYMYWAALEKHVSVLKALTQIGCYQSPHKCLAEVALGLGIAQLRHASETARQGAEVSTKVQNLAMGNLMSNYPIMSQFFSILQSQGDCLEEYICRQAVGEFCDCSKENGIRKSDIKEHGGGAFEFKCQANTDKLTHSIGKEWTMSWDGHNEQERSGGRAGKKGPASGNMRTNKNKAAMGPLILGRLCTGHAHVGVEVSGGINEMAFSIVASKDSTQVLLSGSAGITASMNFAHEGACTYTKEFAYPKTPMVISRCGGAVCVVIQLQWVATLEMNGLITGQLDAEASADLDFDLGVEVTDDEVKITKKEIKLSASAGVNGAMSMAATATLKLGPKISIFPIPGVPVDFYPTADFVLAGGGTLEIEENALFEQPILLETERDAEGRAIMLEAASAPVPASLAQANATESHPFMGCFGIYFGHQVGLEIGGLGFPGTMELSLQMISEIIIREARDAACRMIKSRYGYVAPLSFGSCHGVNFGSVEIMDTVCDLGQRAVVEFTRLIPLTLSLNMGGHKEFFKLPKGALCSSILSKPHGAKQCLKTALDTLGQDIEICGN